MLVTFSNQEKYPLLPLILLTIPKPVFKRPKFKSRSVPKEKRKGILDISPNQRNPLPLYLLFQNGIQEAEVQVQERS
jgi:hypothetical protein